MADLKKHIAPIVEAEKENELARRFDYLMYSIELAMLERKNLSKNIGAVVGIAEKLSLMQDSVPQIKEQKLRHHGLGREIWKRIKPQHGNSGLVKCPGKVL